MNNINVRPLADRIIVQAKDPEAKSSGGVIIPDSAKEQQKRGIVIAAGPGKPGETMAVSVGDEVLYGA